MQSDLCIPSLFIGCAGWSVSSAVQQCFPAEGSHLERYAAVLPAVEINTSFYRPHRPGTYARWRDSVPASFRFAVKIPKAITHERRLQEVDAALADFIGEAGHLGDKLGCLLVQLPPSLRYDSGIAQCVFAGLRNLTNVSVACEPRHVTWFSREAGAMLREFDVVPVRADPQVAPLSAPSVHERLVYLRLHGSPRMYHSPYDEAFLDRLAVEIRGYLRAGKEVWCVFDNTASGAAQPNALSLLRRFRTCSLAQCEQVVRMPQPLR